MLGEVGLSVLEIEAGLREKSKHIRQVPVHVVLLVDLRLEFLEERHSFVNLVAWIGLNILLAVEHARGIKLRPLISLVVPKEFSIRGGYRLVKFIHIPLVAAPRFYYATA